MTLLRLQTLDIIMAGMTVGKETQTQKGRGTMRWDRSHMCMVSFPLRYLAHGASVWIEAVQGVLRWHHDGEIGSLMPHHIVRRDIKISYRNEIPMT